MWTLVEFIYLGGLTFGFHLHFKFFIRLISFRAGCNHRVVHGNPSTGRQNNIQGKRYQSPDPQKNDHTSSPKLRKNAQTKRVNTCESSRPFFGGTGRYSYFVGWSFVYHRIHENMIFTLPTFGCFQKYGCPKMDGLQ